MLQKIHFDNVHNVQAVLQLLAAFLCYSLQHASETTKQGEGASQAPKD